LRPRTVSRAAVGAGALALATVAAPAQSHAQVGSAAARAEPPGTARVAAVGVAKKRLHVRSGHRVAVVGTARPGTAGLAASLQVRRPGGWRRIDRDRTAASGRYVLRARVHRAMSAPVRVRVKGVGRRLGRMNVYRWANASWYGPGLYGNPLGCGGTLYPGRIGVAHKTLPCGSRLTLRHRGRTVRVRVIDRGPYVGGREYDLTEATAQRLRFGGHGPILATR
jgi:rare lipoprotein A